MAKIQWSLHIHISDLADYPSSFLDDFVENQVKKNAPNLFLRIGVILQPFWRLIDENECDIELENVHIFLVYCFSYATKPSSFQYHCYGNSTVLRGHHLTKLANSLQRQIRG